MMSVDEIKRAVVSQSELDLMFHITRILFVMKMRNSFAFNFFFQFKNVETSFELNSTLVIALFGANC